MNILLEKLLKKRDWTVESIQKYNLSNHDLLKDIDLFANGLEYFRLQQDRIVIVPDFDMDGIASGTLGYAGLSELGFNVSLYIPDASSGYGFKQKDIDKIIALYPDVKVILTCDVGMSAYSGIEYAREKGLYVLVTDHHKPVVEYIDSDNGGEKIERRNLAHVIINPMRKDETYKLGGICGAHVLWQCLDEYTKHYQPHKKYLIDQLRLFAGIGTISDTMPLLYENRQLVKDSLEITKNVFHYKEIKGESEYYNRAFSGFRNILNHFRNTSKIKSPEDITSMFYGFYVAPMFNSLKRLEGDMRIAFGVFFDSVLSEKYVQDLVKANEKRKVLVKEYLSKIESETEQGLQTYGPLIYSSDAPGGILGLLAMNLCTKSKLPTVVLNSQTLHGSGRSPSWYLFNTRVSQQGFFVAGHEGAFGCGVDDLQELERLNIFLNSDILNTYCYLKELAQRDGKLAPDEEYFDLYLSTFDTNSDLNFDLNVLFEFMDMIKYLEPFGKDWEEPSVKISFKPSDGEFRIFGKDKNHLKIILNNGFEILLWSKASDEINLRGMDSITMVGKLSINEFNGNKKINFMGNLI